MFAQTARAASNVILQTCGSGNNVQKVFKQDFSVAPAPRAPRPAS